MTGTAFAVWAPERPRRAGHRRLQPLGRPRAPDAVPGRHRGLGAVRARRRRRDPVQVRRLRAGRAVAAQGRPHGHPGRAAARDRVGRLHVRYEWGDEDWLAARGRGQQVREPVSVYEVHLGSWRPGLSYRPARRRADRLRHRPGLHPRGVPAGGRAPVRRVLGLPGHLLLRARPPGSAARTSSATWWTGCTRPGSA